MARRRSSRRTQKRLSSKFNGLIALFALALIPTVAGIGLKLWLTEERLEALIEESLNVDLEVERVDLKIFRYPARINFQGLSLRPRQQNARPTLIFDKGYLDVATFPLFQKRIDLLRVMIQGGSVDYRLKEDGSDNLLPLFKNPSSGKGDKKDGSGSSPRADKLNIEELDWGLGIREIHAEGLHFRARIEAADLTVSSENVQLRAYDIELDPRQLRERNQAKLNITADISLDGSSAPTIHYGRAELDASCTAKLFNVSDREFDPDLLLEVILSPTSYLSMNIPTLQGWWEKLKLVSRIGIPIGELPERVEFDQHPLQLHYHRDQFTTRSNIQLSLADWQAALLANSTYHIPSTQHHLMAEFRTGQVQGKLVSDWIDDWIDTAPKWASQAIEKLLKNQWIKDGRITLGLSSTGSFQEPSIKLDNEVPSLSDLLENLKENPGGLLKGLLD